MLTLAIISTFCKLFMIIIVNDIATLATLSIYMHKHNTFYASIIVFLARCVFMHVYCLFLWCERIKCVHFMTFSIKKELLPQTTVLFT